MFHSFAQLLMVSRTTPVHTSQASKHCYWNLHIEIKIPIFIHVSIKITMAALAHAGLHHDRSTP